MRRVRVAVVGCGNVAEKYIPHLQQSPAVKLVAVCDPQLDRASGFARTYAIEHAFTDVDRLLGDLACELVVNLTPMPLHASIARKALRAGRNVWNEKPLAADFAEAQVLLSLAQRHGVGLWAAPSNPISPSFRTMSQLLGSGAIGQVATAHGIIGTSGPAWPGSGWFYRRGGGSLFDLGVYNITLLTGLLGPAHGVVAMSGTAIPQRTIAGEIITVEADDTTALILDHGDAVYSVVQSGFVYAAQRDDWTVQVIGTAGAMIMGGYAWEPGAVSVYRGDTVKTPRRWEAIPHDPAGFAWQSGATYIAECLATGERPLLSGEHAVHVLEVMQGARRAAQTGQRVQIASTFRWPLLEQGGAHRGDAPEQIP